MHKPSIVICSLLALLVASLAWNRPAHGGDFAIVDCAGVGYRAAVSAFTGASLPEPGAAVDLRVHTHFAQDKFSLYAFATRPEEELFLFNGHNR